MDKEYEITEEHITATAYGHTMKYDAFVCVLNDWRIDWNELYESIPKITKRKLVDYGIKIKNNALKITKRKLVDYGIKIRKIS